MKLGHPSESDVHLAVRPRVAIRFLHAPPHFLIGARRRYPVVTEPIPTATSITVQFDPTATPAPLVGWAHLGQDCLVRVPPGFNDWDWLEKLAELHAFCQGQLPLHAAVATDGERGILLVGAAHSGKTAVLLALMMENGKFMSDDGVFVDPTGQATGVSKTIELRSKYWRNCPSFRQQVPFGRRVYGDFWQFLQLSAHYLPGSFGRRLARAAERRQRWSFWAPAIYGPDRCIESGNLHILTIVEAGTGSDLAMTPLSPAAFARQVCSIQLQHFGRLLRQYQAEKPQHAPAPLANFEATVLARAEALARDRLTYRLVLPPHVPLATISKTVAAWCQPSPATTEETLAYAS